MLKIRLSIQRSASDRGTDVENTWTSESARSGTEISKATPFEKLCETHCAQGVRFDSATVVKAPYSPPSEGTGLLQTR
eukprot:6198566-Pleurochrysis_carterae.AAC.7